MSTLPPAPLPPVGVAGSAEALSRVVAGRVLDTLAFRLKDDWVTMAHVAVSGGLLLDGVFEALSENPSRRAIPWDKVHVWWTDERYLPEGHSGRFETKARAAGIMRIGMPEANLHPIPGPVSDEARPDRAAEEYTRLLHRFAPHGRRVPVFDLTLLEVGPTGEVAGLYPGHGSLRATEPVAALWDSPGPCAQRMTMSFPTMAESTRVWLLAAGAERAVAVGRSLLGQAGSTGELPPAAQVHGVIETAWWLDAKASRAVPSEVRQGLADPTPLDETDTEAATA